MTENIQCQYNPQTVSPPGWSIEDILEERGISRQAFADRMGSPLTRINEIIKGTGTIDVQTAVQLERVLGAPADFWMRRETRYRANLASIEKAKQLDSETPWLQELPIQDMKKLRWISADSGKGRTVLDCLQFFDVDTVDAWRKRCDHMVAAFRSSKNVKESRGAVAAWLRQGEIEAEKQLCLPFDREALLSTLNGLRRHTLEDKPTIFVPIIQEACARCGVAVVFVPAPTGCPASGATRWLGQSKAIVQLSLRYKSNDHLWFTFFHEIGHVILHKRSIAFFELNGGSTSTLEGQADIFARDMLIPPKAAVRLRDLAHSSTRVQLFARDISVAPGIVVGRLQHDGIVPWNRMNELKIRYTWNNSTGDFESASRRSPI